VAGSLALVPAALAQQATTQQTTKVTTVEGKVVRYEPGKTIVVMEPDNKEVSFVLSPNVEVPGDIEIGRMVTLSTEPSASGPVVVTRITIRSMTPEGNIKTETETKSTDASGEQTSVKTTTITGTVSAFEPGRSVTFVLPDKKTVVYTVDTSSVVPSDLAVGKVYTVETTTTKGGQLVVKRITSTRTIKKETSKP
jgi:hypothetical protein